jgi:hypothetical protein
MFSKILDILDKPYKDNVYEYLSKNNKFNKTREWFGLSILLIFIGILVSSLFFFKNKTYIPPAIYQVNKNTLANKTYMDNRLIVLDKPRGTKKALEQWSINFVNNFYNFTFNNFDKQLAEDKRWFTKAGYNGFIESINNIGLKKQLIDKKQIVSLTVSKNPLIKDIDGEIDELDGKYKWQVEVEAIMSTTSGFTVYKNVTINMILVYEMNNNEINGLYVHNLDMR